MEFDVVIVGAGPAGLSAAGACGGPQTGGFVQRADAAASDCHHNGHSKPGSPADLPVDQSVAVVKGANP